MVINEKNLGKLQEIIRSEEGRATARTITAKEMLEHLQQVEKHIGICKKDMIDVMVDIDINAQNFPKAYKYTPESTQFIAIYKKNGWHLLEVGRKRTRVYNKQYIITFTAAAKEAIIKRMSEY